MSDLDKISMQKTAKNVSLTNKRWCNQNWIESKSEWKNQWEVVSTWVIQLNQRHPTAKVRNLLFQHDKVSQSPIEVRTEKVGARPTSVNPLSTLQASRYPSSSSRRRGCCWISNARSFECLPAPENAGKTWDTCGVDESECCEKSSINPKVRSPCSTGRCQ